MRPPSLANLPPRAWIGLAVGAVFCWRLAQISSLALPPWVDSIHHTLLVRILLEQRRIPETWGPYLPRVPLYYHFGFHLCTALLALATGLTGTHLGRAVLLAGQLWQGVVAAGLGLLSWTLWRRPAKVLTALLLVGFVSQMPAYYLTWGRYSLLAGLGLLTLGMAAAVSGRSVAVAAVLAATCVTHYYAFALLVAFVILLAIADPSRRRALLAALAAGIVLALPWMLRVWIWVRAFERPHSGAGGASAPPGPGVWSLLGPLRSHVLLLLAVLGLGLLAWRAARGRWRDRPAEVALLLWTIMLLALLGPWQVGPFRPDHAAIVLFIPVVLLSSEALWELLPERLAACVVLGLTPWGLWETSDVVRADTILAGAQDVAAIEWVESHTPREAAFLVDVEPWMGVWRGADGGWWITPLTGRRTVLPPLAYSWGELEATERIRRSASRLHSLGPPMPPHMYCGALEQLMRDDGARYYYTRHGHEAGRCAGLETVYQSPGVRILEMRTGSSGAALPSAAGRDAQPGATVGLR